LAEGRGWSEVLGRRGRNTGAERQTVSHGAVSVTHSYPACTGQAKAKRWGSLHAHETGYAAQTPGPHGW
jgi:hypothetical protein